MATKSRMQQILGRAQKTGTVTSGQLKSYFKKVTTDPVDFDDNFLRIARFAVADGYLKRVSPGEYKLTKKGQKQLQTA